LTPCLNNEKENLKIFEGLSALHPIKVFSQPVELPFSQLPLKFFAGQHVYKIEEQIRKICFVD